MLSALCHQPHTCKLQNKAGVTGGHQHNTILSFLARAAAHNKPCLCVAGHTTTSADAGAIAGAAAAVDTGAVTAYQ